MYITKEELEKRLNKTSISVVEKIRVARSNNEKRLTHDERKVIGILNEVDTQKNIAELMGVSQTTVSNVSRGMVGPATGVNKELKKDVEEGKESLAKERLDREARIQEQLVTNLAAALGHVANNLHDTDATDASKIAVDMSKILDRVTGSGRDDKGNRTAIIINVPSMKEEKSYSVISV